MPDIKHAVAFLIAISIPSLLIAGQKYDVKIIDRQDNSNYYSYVIPGYSSSTTSGKVDCSSYGTQTECSGSAVTNGVSTPGMVGSYQVRGATLALQLPDGRIAVVNCENKTNWNPTKIGWYRSCRIPLVSNLQADFDGDNAKLSWSVSIDGKKMQSETYKILGVYDKPQ